MTSKNTAVFGIYATPSTAEAAVDHLLAHGFTNSAISVLLPDDATTRAFAHEKNTKAPEGTTTGVTTGGVIGGTLGLLAGIGALAIPGIGPLIAAGPIVATLAGVGAGGAVGGIVGALVGMGIPEYEAKRFEGAVKGGGTLLSVHCDTSEQIASAKQALKDTGARDVASSGEASSTTGARETFGDLSQPTSGSALGTTPGTATETTIDPVTGTRRTYRDTAA
ncbi:MAG TPA: DUF3341 domain-containing protein [Granulicella sp.]|jgi:hypothetical protein|nr:DUF3341 domain-containing protein [Granulicella sp.]